MLIFPLALLLGMSFQSLIKSFYLSPFFLQLFINHDKPVFCHGVIASWQAKKGIFMSHPLIFMQDKDDSQFISWGTVKLIK